MKTLQVAQGLVFRKLQVTDQRLMACVLSHMYGAGEIYSLPGLFVMQSAADDTKSALCRSHAEPGPTDMPGRGSWGVCPSWGSGWLASRFSVRRTEALIQR
jgi:hypothetical protein